MLHVTNLIGCGAVASPGIGGNDANTQLLLHCDGTDASTTFTDSSQNGFTVSVNANAQIDTAQSKFGGSSLLCDGTGDYLSVADDAALRPGTGDFTWDFWLRYAAGSKNHTLATKGYVSGGDFLLQTDTGATPKIIIYASGSPILTQTTGLSLNTWYHIAVERSSGTITIYVNGTADGNVANSTNFNSTGAVNIGGTSAGTGPTLNGWMDEVRYSDNARYGGTFTPETGPYS